MSLPTTAAPGRAAWRPTLAHTRAGGLAVLLTALGLVLRRTDLLVLAAPFVLVFTWGQLTRPQRALRFDLRADRSTLREGDTLTAQVRIWPSDGVEALAVSLRPAPHVTYQPHDGGVVIDPRAEPSVADGDPIRIPFRVGATRWGQRTVGPGLVGAVSTVGAFRFGPGALQAAGFLALPRPTAFDAAAPLPHPRGLVGAHRSVRPGEGAEFYAIREFQLGDRTRRIHWPRSLREDRLFVRATHADQDAHVAVVLDAHQDLGGTVNGASPSGRGAATPSTLDLGVRSAAAVSEHFLGTGDRVSLAVLSAHHRRPIPPGSGPQHLRRILTTLGRVTPLSGREDGPVRERLPHLRGGGLVVLVSPLASPDVASLAAGLTRSGHTVVVVDVMVEDARPPGADGQIELAWRIRALERQDEIHALRSQGVPVVPWAGPGSLDLVLRGLARRGPTVRVR